MRKVDKKIGYAKKRAMEDAGEVEMKDIDDSKAARRAAKGKARDGEGEKMELDEV